MGEVGERKRSERSRQVVDGPARAMPAPRTVREGLNDSRPFPDLLSLGSKVKVNFLVSVLKGLGSNGQHDRNATERRLPAGLVILHFTAMKCCGNVVK